VSFQFARSSRSAGRAASPPAPAPLELEAPPVPEPAPLLVDSPPAPDPDALDVTPPVPDELPPLPLPSGGDEPHAALSAMSPKANKPAKLL
jgi:hypothetical protein